MTDNISNLLNSRVSGAVSVSKPSNAAEPESARSSPDSEQTVARSQDTSLQVQPQQQPDTVDTNELQDKVAEINQFIQNVSRDLSFGIDDQSGRTVITVIDSESGQVVRQIPSEETLAIVRQLSDAMEQKTADGQSKIPNGIILSFSV